MNVIYAQIQKYSFYFIKNQNIAEKLCSKAENVFLKKYAGLRYEFYKENVLKNFAKNYRDLNDVQFYFAKTEDERKEKKMFV